MNARYVLFCSLLMAGVSWSAVVSAQTAYDGSMPEDKVKPPTAAQRFVFPVPGGHLAFVPYGPGVIRITTRPEPMIR
jgi:hypothetical protein